MNKARFGRLCAGMKRLSVGQMRAREASFEHSIRASRFFRASMPGDSATGCSRAAPSLQRWGEGTGLQRLRCKACRMSLGDRDGWRRIRRPEKLLEVRVT